MTKSDFDLWEKEWGGKCFFNEGTNRSKGEAILVSRNFSGDISLLEYSERTIIVSMNLDKNAYTLVNCYAPNSSADKCTYYNYLCEKLSDIQDNLIIVGDFNCTRNNDLDIISGLPHSQTDVDSLNNFLDTLSLTDAYRHQHPNTKDYSYNRINPFIARRIDYCFITENISSVNFTCILYSKTKNLHGVFESLYLSGTEPEMNRTCQV